MHISIYIYIQINDNKTDCLEGSACSQNTTFFTWSKLTVTTWSNGDNSSNGRLQNTPRSGNQPVATACRGFLKSSKKWHHFLRWVGCLPQEVMQLTCRSLHGFELHPDVSTNEKKDLTNQSWHSTNCRWFEMFKPLITSLFSSVIAITLPNQSSSRKTDLSGKRSGNR